MFCEALPRELWVSGRAYPIDTDFRAWIRLTETLLDPRLEDLKKAAACLALYQKAPADLPEALTERLCTLSRAAFGVSRDVSPFFRFSFQPFTFIGVP